MKTAIRESLNVEFPIFAFSHCRDVVAAVSKAGGLGVLGVSALSTEQMRIELEWIENEVGDRPYGIDVMIPASTGVEEGGLTQDSLGRLIPDGHRHFVDSLLQEHRVPPLPAEEVPDVQDWRLRTRELVEVALSHKAKLIANALGPPPPWLIEQAHSRGILVAALVGTTHHALKQKAAGVDIIVAQGYEAGGHTGDIATMVLVPEIVDTVAPTPVLAAGGIANGRQMAAALALGAQGVWTGSVWLTTEEAETHPVVKQKFLEASSSDTLRSRSLTGKPARQLRSAWTDAWEDPSTPEPLPMPLQGILAADARARIVRAAHQRGSGAEHLINYFVGQVVGSLNHVRPVRTVVESMVLEYLEAVERVEKWTNG